MVYQTEPHTERAREHLESDDYNRLIYACLELRFALERIAYQKLPLRLDKITIEEIRAWQPRRAMDRFDIRSGPNPAFRSVLSGRS